MKKFAALLGIFMLSACSASEPETAPKQIIAETVAATESAQIVETEPAPDTVVARTRNLLFMQVDLFQNGADPSPDYALAEMLALMGREDLITSPENEGVSQCPRRWVDPVDSITQSSSNARVVVLVEHPHRSRQRAFINDVASALIDEGFSYYASDGFDLSNPPLNLPEFAKLNEGLFVREPIFGRLVRNLKSRDVNFLSLDLLMSPPVNQTPETLARHEASRRIMQADRLALTIMESDPESRIIVHLIDPDDVETVSYSNAVDFPISQFAERLREKTGVTPLMLGQTKCRAAWTGSVMLPKLGRGGRSVNKYGIVVAHPIDTLRDGRPEWRRARGDKDVTVPNQFLTHSQPVIIEARRADDPEISVPEDRLLLLPGDNLPLLLPAGSYRIEGWTKNGPIAGPVEVLVE
ncbi:MAG: hypothetical protein ACRBEQ_11010 [Hyphomonas sp.]